MAAILALATLVMSGWLYYGIDLLKATAPFMTAITGLVVAVFKLRSSEQSERRVKRQEVESARRFDIEVADRREDRTWKHYLEEKQLALEERKIRLLEQNPHLEIPKTLPESKPPDK